MHTLCARVCVCVCVCVYVCIQPHTSKCINSDANSLPAALKAMPHSMYRPIIDTSRDKCLRIPSTFLSIASSLLRKLDVIHTHTHTHTHTHAHTHTSTDSLTFGQVQPCVGCVCVCRM